MTLARVVRWVETYAPLSLAAAAIGTTVAGRPAATNLVLASGLSLQAALAIRHASRRDVRMQLAGGTIPAGFLAVVLSTPPWDVALVPLGLACGLVGIGLVASAVVRARAARSLPRRRRAPEERAGSWRRDLAAALLALPLLLLTLLLAPLTSFRIPMDWTRPSIPPEEPRPEERTPPDERGGPDFASDLGSRATSGSAGTTEPDPFLQREVMEVRATGRGASIPAGSQGPLYLRGIPYADGDDGLWHEDLAAAARRADAFDGVSDGWCDVSATRSPSNEMQFTVRQARLETTQSGELVVHAPPGTTSVGLPSVRAETGGVVLTRRGGRAAPFTYSVAVETVRANTGLGNAAATATLPRPRWRAPAGSKLRVLELAAADAVAGARTDAARVRAVMASLRERFRFESVVDAADETSALESFVVRGGGSPEQFARAGVLMLRSVGVPARVGTGYLATEWDRERKAYVVRARHRHAWIEVPFAGRGWVVFDPTPYSMDPATGYGGDEGGFDDGAPAPGWNWDEPPLGFFPSIRRWFEDAFFELLEWLRAHPWPFVCAAALALVLVARAFHRRSRRLAGEEMAPPAASGPWQDLLEDLARRGWRRRPSQTALEFAHAVVTTAGAGYGPFVALTARQQEARFGGRALGPVDEDAIRAFRASL